MHLYIFLYICSRNNLILLITDSNKYNWMKKNKYAGTKTQKNLEIAFAGESEARNKYTYFAAVAQKEGYDHIAEIFLKTANNEKEHAKLWFAELNDGLCPTTEALLEAANNENDDWQNKYEHSAQIAEEEGFTDLAAKFRMVASIEKQHEKNYRSQELLNAASPQQVETKLWECRCCGHVIVKPVAPCNCQVCNQPNGYFEVTWVKSRHFRK